MAIFICTHRVHLQRVGINKEVLTATEETCERRNMRTGRQVGLNDGR
jgi:hypothetical protein